MFFFGTAIFSTKQKIKRSVVVIFSFSKWKLVLNSSDTLEQSCWVRVFPLHYGNTNFFWIFSKKRLKTDNFEPHLCVYNMYHLQLLWLIKDDDDDILTLKKDDFILISKTSWFLFNKTRQKSEANRSHYCV